jgi:hypothetical protein
MKKTLLTFIVLLTIAGSAMAQSENLLSVADIELPQNSEAPLVVSFQFDAADTYTGYQFNLELPEELEFIMGEGTNVKCVKGACHDDHSVVANLKDGLVKVAALSGNSNPLIGTSGTLLTFTIKPSSPSLEIGHQYTGKIKNIVLVPVIGDKKVLTESTFTITIGEPDDGRIKFDETSTTLPSYTAGEKANVSMKRTITAGQWSTIVLPFTLTKAKAEAAFGDDVELREFTGFEVDYGDDDENVVPLSIKIIFTPYTMGAKKSITGGKPFLIKTSKNITSFEADDVTLVGSVTDVVKSDTYDTSGKFTGTLVKSVIPEDGLFISDNKFYYSAGATNVKAFRCWLELGAVLDKDTDFGARISLSLDGETTDINTVHGLGIKANGTYDLQGRKIENPKKGLYINNGKKVVVK